MQTPSTDHAGTIPLSVRVELAHACVQVVADEVGADLLHIKGPAARPELRPYAGAGSDVDVIVRPDHVPLLLAGLARHGFREESTFAEGSSFEHAANWRHPDFGLVDVHRSYPGLHHDPARAFSVLWERRESRALAHQACAVPDLPCESLIVLLHAARTPGAQSEREIAASWTDRTPEDRDEVTALAQSLGAQVGLAAATGHLEDHAADPEAALWRTFEDRADRLGEWQARLGAARGWRAKAGVLGRALRVNTYVLGQRLGRPPTRRDVAVESMRRVGRALRAARPGGAR